jgi:nucleoside-diphosphate-sugar epimerase
MIRSCLESKGDIRLTLGEQRKDFLYVQDVVRAIQLLLAGPDRFGAAFVSLDCGSGQAVSIREFVETVHRLTRSRAVLRFGALPYRENEIMFSQADTSMLQSLGWKPTVSLEEGIRSIIKEDFVRD